MVRKEKMSQTTELDELTSLNLRRRDLELANAIKEVLGFASLSDLASFLLSLGVGEVEKRERERSEVFPVPSFPVSSNFVMGYKCAFCAESGIGEFVYRTKADLFDHQAVDRDLLASGRHESLKLLHIDERRKIHESLRQKKAEEHKEKYEAFKQALMK
jgi:hypothetical protein